jgi:hypothetical protein
VALVARRVERLEALAIELSQRHGIEAFALPADLSGFEAHIPVIEAIAARGRHVDVLVNNAGFGIPQSFTAVPWERQRDFLMIMAVNACGLAYDVIPGMVERGAGAIINVASMAAFSPGVAGNSLYPGVKGLMVKFSQSLDSEYRAAGLKVTAVCPGFTKTEFAQQAGVAEIMEREHRMLWQTAEAVVQETIRGNERGKVVVIPGWQNRLSAILMKTLPEPVLRSIIAAGSAKYHLDS